MMITREKLDQILFGRLTTHCTLYDYIPKQMKKVIDDAITEILSELSTAELPVQGEAVAIADSITLRMLKTWCHTNRFRIEIDLGGVATAGTFGNMRRLWDADLLTMFPALNTRRESDTTPTLKPSVNELVAALERIANMEPEYMLLPQPNMEVSSTWPEGVWNTQSAARNAIASHQSAKEQV
jgi:hypothetical protein